ncbi:MAG: metallophosphoesterase [Bacteroidota bacterium]
MIRSGLYGLKQLFTATIIGGPVLAGFVMSMNLWARGKRWLAAIPVFSGMLLDALLIIPVYFSVDHIRSIVFRNLLAIGLLLFLQTVIAFLVRAWLEKCKKTGSFIFPRIDENLYHRRMTFPLVIIATIYFFTDFVFPFYSWILLGFYLFPNVYAYLHICNTYGNRKILKPIPSSIVFLGCLFPFTFTFYEYLSPVTNKGFLFFTWLNVALGYYLIFVFYIFLFILALEIVLLVNKLTRVVPGDVLKNKYSLMVTLLVMITSSISIAAIGTHINNHPVIHKYSIIIPKKSSTLNSLKVICVADLHLKNITSTAFLKNVVNTIRMTNPDLIVIHGDIAETYGKTSNDKLDEFLELLKGLKATYGIYGVKGNHEYPGDRADKMNFYNRAGITMLADSLIELDEKFCIAGLKYRGNHKKRPVDSLVRCRTKDLPILLLDHAPYCLEEAFKNKIDVQFSGHTHYGQIWPFNYITEAVYDMAWGYRKSNYTHLFVTCGAQDALLPGRQDFSVPVRTGSVSEIMEIGITFK